MKHYRLLFSLVLAVLFFGYTAKSQTVADLIVQSEDHDTLQAAVEAADLVTTLQGDGPFTVFAPVDAAFAALPEGTLDSLLKDPGGELKDILLYHVVPSKVMSSELTDGQTLETVLGQSLTVRISGDSVLINNALVTTADLEATNGVVHVIDSVLLPAAAAETVVDVVTGNDDYTTLVAALTREDLTIDFVDTLSGEGPFTVFAPTNEAFAALLEELNVASLDDLDAATLEAVLQMHVVPGKVMSADLTDGMMAETLLGPYLLFNVGDDVTVTDPEGRMSIIVSADMEAGNGVVHSIDTVLLPGPETVVDIATGNDNFSTLVAALTREDLTTNFADTLSGEGPFTVFAPTNEAFTALLDELGVASLDEVAADTLEAILKMHVVPGRIMSTDLADSMMVGTLLGPYLAFNVADNVTIIDPEGRESTILTADLQAQNGVVHVIDTVLLPGPETVVDIATGNDDFSTLVAALTREDLTTDFVGTLSGEGPFTVFAPTNDAFAALLDELGIASLDEISADSLEAILKLHVVPQRIASAELTDGMVSETLQGQYLTYMVGDSVVISDPGGRTSNVTNADLQAQNGVVHVIDTVLLPGPATVVDIATGNDAFSTLVAALTREDLTTDFIGTLSGDGPFTVFAPTNDAFAALLDELGVASLDEVSADTLEAILQMHVVPQRVLSADLTDGMTAETLYGQQLTFAVEDSLTITDPNGRMSNITAANLQADNGVVHVIDKVLLWDMRPETVVDIATGNDDFSTLVAALTREDLTTDYVTTLSGEGPFTVFAPTNDAFAALLDELGVASLDEISADTLEAILQMHVLQAKVLSSDLTDGMMAETLYGQQLTFNVGDSVTITDPNGRVSRIDSVDLQAQNGVVHVIDKVLLWDMRPATVVDIVTGNDDYSTLVAALTREDLTTDFVGILSGDGPYTVFAPTNDAFAALLDELGVASLDDVSADTLEAILQMHVLPQEVMSADISDGMMAETLLGQQLIFNVGDSVTITDPNGRVINITAVDLEAQNGVVHVVDTVILMDLTPTSAWDIDRSSFHFYPNPADGYITVRSENMGSTLQITDISGRVVYAEKMVRPSRRINVSGLNSGIYFISLENKGSRLTKKLIVK